MKRGRAKKIAAGVAIPSLFVATGSSPADAHGFSNLGNWGCAPSNPGCAHAAPHSLSATAGIGGNVVGMWQAILYEAALAPCSNIDGAFGANTKAATKNYQARFGLTPDGVVGPVTWGNVQYPDDAWEFLGAAGNNLYNYDYATVIGSPASSQLDIQKNANPGGSWKWKAGFTGGNWNDTNHPGKTWVLHCP